MRSGSAATGHACTSGPGGGISGAACAPRASPSTSRAAARKRGTIARRLAHAAQHRREETVGVVTVRKQLQLHAITQLLGALAAPDLLHRHRHEVVALGEEALDHALVLPSVHGTGRVN